MRCAATTTEYAILLCLVASLMLVSVAPLRHQLFHSLGHLGDENATSRRHSGPDGAATESRAEESQSLAPGWILFLQFAAVSVTCMWLLLRPRAAQRKCNAATLLEASNSARESRRVFRKRQQILRILSNNREALLKGELEVGHIASREPLAIAPSLSVEAARAKMESLEHHHLLVCEADQSLVGLVSKHYLDATSCKRVSEAMTTEPPIASSTALLNPTITHMLNENVSCVAVVEDGKAIGTLTSTDIHLALQVALQVLAGTVAPELGAAQPDALSVSGVTCGNTAEPVRC